MSDFKTAMQARYPSINVENAIKIFDNNISLVQSNSLQKDEMPILPLNCDLIKNIFLRSMLEYIEFKHLNK